MRYRPISIISFLFLIQKTVFYFVFSRQLCSTKEMYALLEFKNSFSIERNASRTGGRANIYPKTSSWKEGTDCCLWDGVLCDNVTGFVIGLDLSGSWLWGPLRSNNSLFHDLQHLQTLDLSSNFFSSGIVSEFANLANTLTYLDLSYSWLAGNVPLEIVHLSKLAFLDLSVAETGYLTIDTQTLGCIAQNLTGLQELRLDGVGMSTVKAEHSLTNLSSSLTILSLSGCKLRGEFPVNVLTLPNLKRLDLSQNNNLTGRFPSSNWSNPLEYISVSMTLFSGGLPETIGGLRLLQQLDLFYCNFTGPLPSSLGHLTNMISLDLSMNSFEGEIPSSLSNLNRLRTLKLEYNKLEGHLPNLFTSKELYHADLSSNQLTGPIPSNPTNHQLPNLLYLALSGNFLSGTMPSWVFSSAPSLDVLDLSYNNLSGPIWEFKSTKLTVVDLSSNNLDGPIPRSVNQLANLFDLNLSSNNFIVELPLFFKLQRLGSLDLSYNTVSVEEPTSAEDTNSTSWPYMWNLVLSNCNLTKFPSLLQNSSNLQFLDLSGNKIQGRIPEWMADMSWLQFLYLSDNSLESPLAIPRSLGYFSISKNNLTGQIPLSICDLRWLQILDLSDNHLSGEIPQCLGNSSTELLVLDLQMNSLSGLIPGTFSNGNSLRSLHLNGNQLEGPLPHALGNCSALEVLDLGNNNINDTFPYWLSTLPVLQVLILRCNKFHGVIIQSRFPQLRILDLSINDFSGNLPPGLFNNLKAMMNTFDNSTGLAYLGDGYYLDSVMVNMKGVFLELTRIFKMFSTIDLSGNKLIGQIPEELGQLVSLKVLNLSHNGLTGTIQSSLSYLKALESLDLSWNNLIGEIPPQLEKLNFLSSLNLSYNHLVGPIPQGTQFNTFESSSYFGNLGLCGFPLSKMCSPLELPSVCHGVDSDNLEFNWNASLVGYMLGFVMGLSLGSLLLIDTNTKRAGKYG